MRLAASFFGRIPLSNSRNPASMACLRDFCVYQAKCKDYPTGVIGARGNFVHCG